MAESAFRSVFCSCTFRLHIRDGVTGEQIRADRDSVWLIIHVIHKSILTVMGANDVKLLIISQSALRNLSSPPSALRTISGICQFLPYKPLINTELLPCHTQPVNCVSQFGTWVNFRFNKSQMAVCCNFGYFHIVFGYFHRSSHTEFCNLFHLLLFQHMSIYI